MPENSTSIKYHDTDNGWALLSASAWKISDNVTIGYIGMLIIPRTLTLQNNIERIQLRMMCPEINHKPCITIVFFYNPTNASDETTHY